MRTIPAMTALEERAVQPFYLKMMGLNAGRHSSELWSDLVAEGSRVSLDEVKSLLNVGAWRPVVMGAWFSTRFAGENIGAELSRAMASSQGSLTAPPLAAACAVVLNNDAVLAMSRYVEADPGRDGSAGLVAAGIEHLSGSAPVAVADEDRLAFTQLLDVATRLRASFT